MTQQEADAITLELMNECPFKMNNPDKIIPITLKPNLFKPPHLSEKQIKSMKNFIKNAMPFERFCKIHAK